MTNEKLISSVTVLGWTGSFYASWTYNKILLETCNAAGNIVYTRVKDFYIYGRKVSKYLNKAQEKYPNAPVLEILENRNRLFWDISEKNYTTTDEFRFGKYAGSKISECTDIDYLDWYYNRDHEEAHKKVILNTLLNNGYVLEKNRKKVGVFYVNEINLKSPREIDAENYNKKVINDLLNTFNTESYFSFNPTKNLDTNGNYEENGIIYHFSDIKTYYYGECVYALPLLKGVGKRIKNKTIKVYKFNHKLENSKLIIEINDFGVF